MRLFSLGLILLLVITNNTAYDQYFVYGGTIYTSINTIVNEIFNQYAKRPNQFAPFFTSFCNGTTATCDGLSQWGTVGLANSGLTPLQILRRFYPPDIYIAETNIFTGYTESFPGAPIRPGDRGFDVQVIQRFLNRIRRNYPAIPAIPIEDGVFGNFTQTAVTAFQRVFDLPQTGIVDRATWNKISYIYTSVARLAELDSEGNTLGIGTIPPSETLRQGSSGRNVIILQHILNFLSQFHPVITPPAQDGIFGPGTAQSVREFQRIMGLAQDAVVGAETWRILYDAYWGARNAGATPPVTPPPTGTFNYIVQSGDTLWSLAQRFGTTIAIIKQLNNLTSDNLSIGQILRIPSSTTEPPVTPPPPTPGTFQYTVRSGDTIFFLAQRFGTTVDAIRSLNNLTTSNLIVGQVLKIPGNAFQYTVQSGDTIFTLAQRFGTTVERIKAFNNLPNNNLSVGQVLLIPQ